ncbi:MAG: hypothetical protein QM699_02690 [Amaricoccus sp.]|uniref:hypothetical protein n=1 Tax=Amaricoccus sp. TaxID=1872485 RepID=UPI0039E3AB7E
MPKTRLLSALAVIAALGGSALAAQAATVSPDPAPVIVVAPTHPFSQAQRDQMAYEAGISPKQAQGLTIGQLGWLKEQHDGRPWVAGPVNVNPAEVHS